MGLLIPEPWLPLSMVDMCLASAILGRWSGRLQGRAALSLWTWSSSLPTFISTPYPLQICFLMAVNVIGQRMNLMVILHGCWLVAILTRRRREAIARLWPNYCLFLTLFLLYQYLLCLGMPPALCIDYPWRWSKAIPMNSALIKWLYLPDFFRAPNSTNLISKCDPILTPSTCHRRA